MGLFDKLKDKVVGGAVRGAANAVGNTVERKAAEALQGQVDKAADKLIKTQPAGVTHSSAMSSGESYAAGEINPVNAGGLAGLAGIMSGFAAGAVNEAAKNMKICPKCNEPASADKKFCPSCGNALPEQTLAAGAVCKACGKQNNIGEKFCSDCGAKLPFAEAEEQAEKMRDGEVMTRWDEVLPQFPKWSCGGHSFELSEDGPDNNGRPFYHFSAYGCSVANVTAYRNLLKQNGFRPAGEYPSDDMLYKRVGGVVYCFESCDPFVSDATLMGVSFGASEPRGGFDYIKPEPKKKGFFGLFKK